MTDSSPDIDALGRRLHEAYETATPTDPPSVECDLAVEAAYAVQRAALAHRDASPVGYKVGFTNERVQAQWGFDSPAFGRLLDDAVLDTGAVAREELVAPRVEPELVFVLDEPLAGPTAVHEVLAATRAVVPAVEVVDERTTGAATATDAVADNAFASRLLPGTTTADPAGTDWAFEATHLRLDGTRREAGVGSSVLGHPARAVAWLAERLGSRGERIEPGELVSTGSLTTAVPLEDTRCVTAAFGSLGSVTVTVE